MGIRARGDRGAAANAADHEAAAAESAALAGVDDDANGSQRAAAVRRRVARGRARGAPDGRRAFLGVPASRRSVRAPLHVAKRC
jgi:hypothetical protein